MSDNNKSDKNELTGPYNTLSVVERTKALGLVPGASPAEKRKPPLPSSPKPPVSPRASHLFQDRHTTNATKTNGTKSKVPPPVVPYRESKKKLSHSPLHSTSSPVQSPSAKECPVSPEAFNTKSPPSFSRPHISEVHSPSSRSPSVAASSYEQPVLRNVNEHASMPKPVETSMGSNVAGIYSEVDTETIINVVEMKQGDEYSTAKCGRDDPSVAPPPPTSGNMYESLNIDEKARIGCEGVGLKSSDASSAVTKEVDSSKRKRPSIPKMKPPLPAAKPVQFDQTPPKPKRTYTTSMQQPESNVPSNSVGSSVDDRLSKPMPLPRGRSEEEREQIADNSSKEDDKPVNPTPAQYCYIDIDIPDSPKQILSTEQLPPTSESSRVVASSKQVTVSEPTNAAVKKVDPQSSNKPKRRPPPPPPAGGKPKPPIAVNKPKLTPGHPNPLPDPTPAKPIPRKWFHLVTKKPGSRSPPSDKKPVFPAIGKDAGNTPSTSKRRDSKKKKFFQRQRQSSEDGSATDSVVDKAKKLTKAVSTEENMPDSPPGFGYDTVGPNRVNEKSITAASFKGGGDMTPHSKHRVLAAYAEVDIGQKIKRTTERPLTNAHSEECLDKLLPQSTDDDDDGRGSFVISPYGTLPRQHHKGHNNKSVLPVYAEVKNPNLEKNKTHTVSDSAKQAQQTSIYAEIEEPNKDDQKLFSSPIKVQRPKQQQQLAAAASVTEATLDSSKEDQPPQVPPQTADSLKLDSPSPTPEVPPQTADSLTLDSTLSNNEYEEPVIDAYATVEARDVILAAKSKNEVSRKPSKEEIAAKTRSLGRSLKPKSKPAPLPPQSVTVPQPVPRSRKNRLSRTQSAEVSSGDDDKIAKTELCEHEDKPKKEPLYESVDDLDLPAARRSTKAKSPPKIAVSESHKQTEFLFKNREFISVSKPSTNTTTTYGNEDSDDSTDWDSGEDEDEQEEQVDQPRSKVYHIAKELLSTERTFVKGLTLLDKNFRQAVLSANRAHDRPVLPEETLNAILSNVGSLYTLNSGLLSQLEDRLAQWDSNPRIGDVLMTTAPFFKLYTEYISNFDNALKLLEESCKKNRAFGELVREFEGQPICANLPLSGYLLETVQRIPRYKLLLQDYLKHIPEDSDDRLNSERSLELISKVAAHVNESIRQVDNFKKLLDVQKKLVGDTGDSLISPSRKLLREGEMLKYSRKEIQSRMFFLFTDILIYASAVPPANTTYKVVKRIPLHGMKVSELDDPEVKHGLQIISTCKSFRLGTNTLEEKIQWMKALQDALFEHEAMLQSRERYRAMSVGPGQMLDNPNESLGTLAPPWLPDNCVSMCMMCSVRFNITKRRHHCRACGNIFCNTCSSYLAALKYQDNKMDRVCLTCFENLTGKGQKATGECVSGKKLRQNHKNVTKARSAVLEVKARERNCEISGYLQMKDKRWRKQWLEVAEFALYVFEKHEDVSAKRSISLPGYLVIYPLPDTNDKTQLCITHPGTGSIFFKTETEEVAMKWVEVFQNAVKLKSNY